MEHGLSFLPDIDADDRSGAAEYFAMALDLCRTADDAGLGYIKMTEHYLRAYGGLCPSPLIFLTAVAHVTRRIRLMTGGILPAFHHPVQLASETAMVDVLSGGRLDVGFARAYMPYEFDAFGVPLDASREIFTDTVLAVRRLWGEPEVSIRSNHFSFERATTLPRPVLPDGPPVWIAAVQSPESFVWAGQHGFGLLVTPSISSLTKVGDLVQLYEDSFIPGAHFAEPRVFASLPVFVAPTCTEAASLADPLLGRYLSVWRSAAQSWGQRTSKDYRGYTGMDRGIALMSPERIRTSGGAIVGSPTAVVDRAASLAEVLHLDGFLWQVDFGGVDLATARASVDMLCESVVPAL